MITLDYVSGGKVCNLVIRAYNSVIKIQNHKARSTGLVFFLFYTQITTEVLVPWMVRNGHTWPSSAWVKGQAALTQGDPSDNPWCQIIFPTQAITKETSL